MPLNLQVKLLQVIQEKEIRRIGATKTRPVDVRVISATDKDLYDLVSRRFFRDDLYYSYLQFGTFLRLKIIVM